MDSRHLVDALDYLIDSELNVHSVLMVRHGYLVLDAYFHPFEPSWTHDLASVTKSVTSTLVGISIDKGHIVDVREPLLAQYPDVQIANVDARKAAITLEHALTMTSGLECVNSPNEVTLFQMMAAPDWVQYILDLPMVDEPGTRFVYNSGMVHVLSDVVRRSTGMNALAFGDQYLFGPLGIDDVRWPTDDSGVNNHGWGDLKLTPHAMAKIGLLFLQKGQWDGRQIVSSAWIDAATARHFPADDSPEQGYGYLWWLSEDGSYSAMGRGHQRIHVLPQHDTVLVVTAGARGRDEGRLNALVSDYLLPSIRPENALPPNPEAADALETKIHEVALARFDVKPVPRLPRMARKVSGKIFTLEANPSGLTELALTFDKSDEATIALSSLVDGRFTYRIGLDDVYHVSPEGRFGLPAAAKGKWEDKKTFIVYLDELGNINQWRIRITFEGEKITVSMRERSSLGAFEFAGTRAD